MRFVITQTMVGAAEYHARKMAKLHTGAATQRVEIKGHDVIGKLGEEVAKMYFAERALTYFEHPLHTDKNKGDRFDFLVQFFDAGFYPVDVKASSTFTDELVINSFQREKAIKNKVGLLGVFVARDYSHGIVLGFGNPAKTEYWKKSSSGLELYRMPKSKLKMF